VDAERVAQLDGLLAQVESLQDGQARETAVTAIQTLLGLYGEALARVMRQVSPETAHALAEDEVIGHLLLVHGLHPVDIETRVRRALALLPRPLQGVAVVGVQDGTARLRVSAACTAEKALIERTIQEAVPDLDAVQVEDGGPAPSFVALDALVRP
jgi:hypothetical protein